jgi:PAS domain S-box-containing protein
VRVKVLQPSVDVIAMAAKARASAAAGAADGQYRQRFDDLIEHSIQGIVVHRRGKILFANTKFAKVFGYPRGAKLAGTSALDQVAQEDRDRVLGYGAARVRGKAAPTSYVFRGRHQRGKPVWVEVRVGQVKWDGAPATMATVVDITARKEAEARLAESEERYRNLVESSLQGTFVHRNNRLLFVNPAFARIFGYGGPAEVLRLGNWRRFQAPHERRRMEGYRRGRMAGQSPPARYEFQGLRKNGSVFWLECIARVVNWSGGPAIQGTLIDISERKAAEAELVGAKQLLDDILASIPLGLSVVDKELRMVAANARFHELLGFPARLRKAGTPYEAFIRFNATRGEYGPGDVERLVAERVALARKFQPHLFERHRPDGTSLEIRGNPMPGGGFITTYNDISARHRTEDDLRANQRLLQTVLDSLPYFLTVKGADSRWQLVNKAFTDFWGQPSAAFIGRTARELPFLPATFRDEVARHDRPALENGRALHETVRRTTPQGRPVTHSIVKVPVRNEHGHVTAVMTLVEDVTAQVAAQEALQRNERLLQTVFDAIPHSLLVKDVNGVYQMANPAVARFYGLTPKQMVGMRADGLSSLTPEQISAVHATDRRVIESGRPVDVPELKLRNAEGQDRWVRMTRYPLFDAGGRVIGLVGMAQDITDAKAAAENLRVNQRLLRAVLDTIPVQVYLKDPQGHYLLSNRLNAEFFGIAPEAMLGRTVHELPAQTAEERQKAAQWDAEVLERGERVEVPELERTDHTGRRRWYRGVKLPLRDGEGRITGIVGMVQEITEQREAARMLMESERHMRLLLNNAPIILYSLDKDGVFTVSEGKELAAVGRKPGEVVGQSAFAVFKDNPERVAELRRALAGEAFGVEVQADGIWFDSRHEPIFDNAGKVAGLVVVSTNVTQRRLAERALREERRLLQTVFDAIPQRLWVKDVNSTFVLVNHAQARFYDLTPEQMAGMGSWDVPGLAREFKQASVDQDRRVMETGAMDEDPAQPFPRNSGEPGLARVIKVPLRNEQGQVIGTVGTAEDVTARIAAENALRASQRLLRTVFDALPLRLIIKDARQRYVMANRAVASLHGVSPEAFVGKRSDELTFLSPQEKGAWNETDEVVYREKRHVEIPEQRIVMANGQVVFRHFHKYPLLDEHGEVEGVVALSEDITERLRIEQALRASRRLLQAVFDSIPYSLMVKDVEGVYLMVNQPQARFYGLTPQRMVGTRTQDLPGLTEEQRAGLVASDRQVIVTGERVDVPEVLLRDVEGTEHWYRNIKLPLRDDDGRVTGLVGLGEVVTERKRAEEELRGNRRLLQTVFDSLPLRIVVRDAAGRFLAVNRVMANDYGVAPEEFPGRHYSTFPAFKESEKAAMRKMLADVEATLAPVILPEVTLWRGPDNPRTFRSVCVPLRDEQGVFQGSITFAEDVTDRKKSELAMLQAQKMESLGVLAGGIAHDFNNLLVTIMGNASLAVLKLPAGNAAEEELRQIETAGERAADLCRQLLAYAGRGRIERQPVNLNQLVQEMTQLLRVSLPKGLAVQYRLAASLPLVEVDPTQIRQVVMNLVINAGEAIGEAPGSITLATGVMDASEKDLADAHSEPGTPAGHFAFLEVADTGAGMSPETRARIFDPFFTTKFTGRGLGLAAVLGIVRGHRGGLRVYSELGKGTSFKVLLPISPAAAAPVGPAQDSSAWRGSGTILVVDDEDAVRLVAVRMLNRLGFETLEAADGASALAALAGHGAALAAVLLDLTMPGMSGEDTLRRMRQAHPGLRILIMSGYNERDVLDRFVGRDVAGFLQKPFKLEQLREKLQGLLQETPPSGSGPAN